MPTPDQRAVSRLEVNAGATVQVLGASASGNGQATPVIVIDTSERGMRLRSPAPMSAGQAVKIEVGDSMFLGEVCYCAPATLQTGPCFHLGVVTRECLSGLASLQQLMRALTPEPALELERRR